jgi:hypothetical protein
VKKERKNVKKREEKCNKARKNVKKEEKCKKRGKM